MHTNYGDLCTEVYDISKPIDYTKNDTVYYIERLKKVEGKILELGCGSGRILIPLLQAGIELDGLDNSTAMLASCIRRCNLLGLKPKLINREMHDFNLGIQYECIIIPSGTFQLIEGREVALRALEVIYNHLNANGVLILDLFIPTNYDPNFISTRSWTTEKNEVLLLEEKNIEVNFIQQKIVSLLKYEKWKDGILIKSELQRLPVSWYGVEEFKLILECVGFKSITISADYRYNYYPQHNGQMITFEAKK